MDVLMKYAGKFFNIKYPTPPNSGLQSIFNLSLIPAVTFSSPLRPLFSFQSEQVSLISEFTTARLFRQCSPVQREAKLPKTFPACNIQQFQNKIDIMNVKTPSRDNALP